MAGKPTSPVAVPPNRWPLWVALGLVAVVLAGVAVKMARSSANDRKATLEAVQAQNDPRLIEERALIEARTLLNADLIPDDGTFFPATGDIETGSLLYTLHEIGPAKKRYYSEDAFLASREKALFVVRPILDRGNPSGRPENYRSRQTRSAETKREEVKTQKKITLAELTAKYAARTAK